MKLDEAINQCFSALVKRIEELEETVNENPTDTRIGFWLNFEDYPDPQKPERAHVTDAGFDLFASFKNDEPQGGLVILPGSRRVITTGVHLSMPVGWEAQIRPRSGLAAKKGVTVLNTPGTIDADYTGEIMVIIQNNGTEDFRIDPGDKIAQMVFKKVPTVHLRPLRERPTNESRGEGGFGSTGVKQVEEKPVDETDKAMLMKLKELSEQAGVELPPDIKADLENLKDVLPDTP
jgi:dUTP pyrophosphatase